MEWTLEFRKGMKGHRINPESEVGVAAIEALNALNVVRTGMYFEALDIRFQILAREPHGSYTKITFFKPTNQKGMSK